ncbi:hypothetical protein BHM03_00030756 [Ensete ventricosum]|nr:hypothetical protein BHM03_00030756 [Ensete ventricosum]
MPMNLKERDRYVVNHGEGLTAVDFDDHVSLVEKEGAGMAERRSDTGHTQKLQGVQWQGRKKGQRSGSRLEEAAVVAGGRCWDGKEQLAGDHIRS